MTSEMDFKSALLLTVIPVTATIAMNLWLDSELKQNQSSLTHLGIESSRLDIYRTLAPNLDIELLAPMWGISSIIKGEEINQDNFSEEFEELLEQAPEVVRNSKKAKNPISAFGTELTERGMSPNDYNVELIFRYCVTNNGDIEQYVEPPKAFISSDMSTSAPANYRVLTSVSKTAIGIIPPKAKSCSVATTEMPKWIHPRGSFKYALKIESQPSSRAVRFIYGKAEEVESIVEVFSCWIPLDSLDDRVTRLFRSRPWLEHLSARIDLQ